MFAYSTWLRSKMSSQRFYGSRGGAFGRQLDDAGTNLVHGHSMGSELNELSGGGVQLEEVGP